MIILVLETLGLCASVTALLLVSRSVQQLPRVLRLSLLGLLSLLVLGHLANILETQGLTWADTFADQFSILVPLLWGLFLLENGRAYLSARLRASDDQVRFFLEAVPASVAWLDADEKLLGFSRAWADALPGSSPGAALGSLLPVALPELRRALEQCLRGTSDDAAAASGEEASTLRDGAQRYFRWSLRRWVHPDRHAPGALLVLEEVTATYEAETKRLVAAEELARSQRLAHVGQMAAGAAHDFNNVLQVIHSAIFELESDADQAQVLDNVRRALDAAQELTRSMLRVGAEPSLQAVALDLVALLREMQRPLSYALGRRHRLEVALPAAPEVKIEGRSSRIQQALLNLAINARDAMPNGGPIQVMLSVEGSHAVLRVRDAGSGINESTRRQLFTPFFTTKGAHGSGLGLNVVKAVVEEHHGRVDVESVVEQGTTFSLRLPLLATASPGSW